MYSVITLCPVPPMEEKAVTWWIPLNFLNHSVDLSTEVKYSVQRILNYSPQTVDRYILLVVVTHAF